MSPMPRTRIIIAAVCLGLIAAVLTYVYVKRAGEAARPMPVVVAQQDIASGAVVKAGMLTIKSFPIGKLPPGAIQNEASVEGMVALEDIKAGEPITVKKLGPGNRLAYRVPPMMRAVTVALDPIIGVGGFIKPGDHVDVVATFKVNDGTITKTVLQDVLLLATGSELLPREVSPEGRYESKSETVPNATLAVTPMDAEKLILAENRGKLRLTLRNAEDTSYVSTRGITSRAVIGNVPPDVPEKKSPSYPPPVRTATVSRTTGMLVPPAGPGPILSGFEQLPTVGSEQQPEVEEGKKIQIIRGTKLEETVVPE
ncbi:MAG: Flp pilus assembly protein CpaB [Armatimonadota bacterium]